MDHESIRTNLEHSPLTDEESAADWDGVDDRIPSFEEPEAVEDGTRGEQDGQEAHGITE